MYYGPINLYSNKRKADVTKIKEDAKSAGEDVGRKYVEENIMKIPKTKRSGIDEENIFEHVNVKNRNERGEDERTIRVNERNERSKGGGERVRMYGEFMRATEQGSATTFEEPSMQMWAYYFK